MGEGTGRGASWGWGVAWSRLWRVGRTERSPRLLKADVTSGRLILVKSASPVPKGPAPGGWTGNYLRDCEWDVARRRNVRKWRVGTRPSQRRGAKGQARNWGGEGLHF